MVCWDESGSTRALINGWVPQGALSLWQLQRHTVGLLLVESELHMITLYCCYCFCCVRVQLLALRGLRSHSWQSSVAYPCSRRIDRQMDGWRRQTTPQVQYKDQPSIVQ